MEKKKIEIEVSGPFYELGLEVKNLVETIANATKDGVQITDLAVLMPYVTRIGELKALIEKLPAEVKAPWDVAQALIAALEGVEKPFLKAPASNIEA